MATIQQILERAARVRLAIFDVDGVLTDGRLWLDDAGHEFKAFHVRDGHGIKLLRATGVEIGVISARRSGAVVRRMRSLGVKHVFQGRDDKIAVFEELCALLKLSPEQTAYAGDDLLDLPVMARVGLAVAVADADARVAEQAHWQTGCKGGHGAVREVCELIMRAQHTLDAAIATRLSC